MDRDLRRTVLTHIMDLSHAKPGSSVKPIIVPEFINFDPLLVVPWRVHQRHRSCRHSSARPLEPEENSQLKLIREGTKRTTRSDLPPSSLLVHRIRHATATRGECDRGLSQELAPILRHA